MTESDPLPAFQLKPMPQAPPAGLWRSFRYTLAFLRGRVQRRRAIRALRAQVREHVSTLDGVMGTLGRMARDAKLESSAFAEENAAITRAEKRRDNSERVYGELSSRKADETSKHRRIHTELGSMLEGREKTLERLEGELRKVEAQRRGQQEERKRIEKEQRRLRKSAEARDEQAAKGDLDDKRDLLRGSAAQMRREAESLDNALAAVDAELGKLDVPYREALSRFEAAKEERDSARRALEDAKEGHRQQLAEFESEQSRRAREVAGATEEIERRLVTLGTLVNLRRVDRPEFHNLYARIDSIKESIKLREDAIENYEEERRRFHKPSLYRGAAALAVGLVSVMTVGWIIWALVSWRTGAP